jgi:ferredoxin
VERLEAKDLDVLISLLKGLGYAIVGPRLRDQAIVYDEISSAADLPRGFTDEQEKGRYRLKRRDDGAYFGFTVAPQGWKRFLFAPRERLWSAQREKKGSLKILPERPEAPKRAFVGVRACDLRAIAIQDRVFVDGEEQDPFYGARRDAAFVVAVECTASAATCFCASMRSGPAARGNFDLAMTEVVDPDGAGHFFIVRSGSSRGELVLDRLREGGLLSGAGAAAVANAREAVERAGRSQSRAIDVHGVVDLLARNFDSPRWDDVASRCIHCANCTLVCPTCFCSTVEDTSDLEGNNAERWRRWDSCFTLDHSYIHGGHVRSSAKSRYRQWMTHKLSSWVEQFGTSGCVGCGRCITWCPVGIDITEETEGMAADERD